MNLIYFCAGFGACSLCIVVYAVVKAMIAKIEKERVREALKTPDLPIRVFRENKRRILFPPDYAVSEQGTRGAQP